MAEIVAAARVDPASGAEGAIALLRRLSPALENVDSSSGALGSAVDRAIDELVPIVVTASADVPTRSAWLEQIWEAFRADQMPCLERLGDRWGDLCAEPAVASAWADRLLPDLRASFAAPPGRRSYYYGTIACLSALLAAQRYDTLIDIVERAPYRSWTYRSWGFRALIAQGRRAEALRYAEASRNRDGSDDVRIARACEALLLEAGMADEAYRRYAMAASRTESTYLAQFRTLARKYPAKPARDLLTDLVATTPGKEAKWFAAAKSAGLFDEAIALAEAGPCDPKTLTRAARDSATRRPAFAMRAALAALRWFSEGYGFEVTSLDIIEAHRYGTEAAAAVDAVAEYRARVNAIIGDGDVIMRHALAYASDLATDDVPLDASGRNVKRRGG